MSKPEDVDRPDKGRAATINEDPQAAAVKIEDLDEDNVVIVVTGPTGSGKSTFIRVASGLDTLGVGHSLKSHTNHVDAVRFFDKTSKRHVVLVDTPGFDNTSISDIEILEMISEWLKRSYQKGNRLSGMLYLHRISDNHMAGTPLKSLRVFRKFFGEDTLNRIYLIATMWDEVDEGIGRRRLEELKQEYWKGMILRGAQTACCRSDDDSPKNIIRRILDQALPRVPVEPAVATIKDLDMDDVVKTVTNPERRRRFLTSKRPKRQPEGIDRPDTREDAMMDEDPAVVKIEDLDENDVVIAVMGPTGSGKSTFIRVASGLDTLGVGHSLKSYTDHVDAVRLLDKTSKRHVVLVDTPGFDNTSISDFEILEMISEWLNRSYKKGNRLSGMLYLHRITDNHIAGTPLKNLRLFRKVCGEDALDKVYLTTTMWDEVDKDIGERRFEELKREYWRGMILGGAQTACCRSDDDSPKDIIRRILDQALPRVPVEPAVVTIEDLDMDDIVIAVMGPTGSGKSTLVRTASGLDTLGVGHSLKSYTNHVSAVRFYDETSNRRVVLVDTPGLDETSSLDSKILEMISVWLNRGYKKNKLLSGILYLHRITDNRMAGTMFNNLRLFRKVCGKDALDKVYLTTTMWDEVDEEIGKRRLDELKREYWRGMILGGAQTACCRNDNDSSKRIIQRIVHREATCRTLLQQEVTDQDKDLKETEAGQELRSQLEWLVEKQIALLRRIDKERKAAADPDLLAELQIEYNEIRAKFDDGTR